VTEPLTGSNIAVRKNTVWHSRMDVSIWHFPVRNRNTFILEITEW